jgi:CAAX protease family protein
LTDQTPVSIHETTAPELEGTWEKSGRSPTSAAILGFISIGIIYAYAQGIIGFVAMAFQHSDAGSAKTVLDLLTAKAIATKNPIRYSVIISEFLFMLVPTIWLIRRWHTHNFLRYIRFNGTPVKEILLAVAASAFFFPASSFISDFFLRELNFPDFLMRINSELFTSYTPGELWWVIAVVCLTPAICEETLFRGYFQRTIERTMGRKSIFVAGILFGFYHMRPLNLVSLSILGILIGFFFYRSKSIIPGMAAHFTNNFIAVLSVYRLPDGNPRIPFLSIDLPFLVVVLATAASLLAVYYFYRATQNNFHTEVAAGSEVPADRFGS